MIKPLFKYAGGKGKMLKYYEPFFPKEVGGYVEPFLGGGAVFCYVWNKWQPKSILGDLNADVMAIYQAIRDDVDGFIRHYEWLVNMYLVTDDRRKYYYDIRHHHAYETRRGTETAAAMLFLMRTCFNGMYQVNHNTNERFGTPCGALAHTSKAQLFDGDAIGAWEAALKKAVLYVGDWKNVTAQFTFPITTDWLWFFDPPYRGAQLKKGYARSFDDDDRRELLELVAQIGGSDGNRVMYADRCIGDGFFDDCPGLHTEKFRRKSTIGRGKASNDVVEVLLHDKELSPMMELMR